MTTLAERSSAMAPNPAPMLAALQAPAPRPEMASKLRLYGQFVGSWALEAEWRSLEGPVRRAEGEWHFDWVLDGRAVQDVWIFPARRLRRSDNAEPWHIWGSTFRWYDPPLDAWRIAWFDPSRGFELRQIGRAQGADIVQIGEDRGGLLHRWRFLDITAESFRWLGEASWDRGASWTQILEMWARRSS